MVRFVPNLLLALALTGCSNLHDKDWSGVTEGGGTVDSGDLDSGDTGNGGDTDETGETGGETGETGDPTETLMDDPGDVLEFSDQEGIVSVDLSDASGDSNQEQEFLLVVLNTGTSPVGFNLRYEPADGADQARLPAPRATGAASAPRRAPISPLPLATPAVAPPLDAADVGVEKDEFLVRSDMNDRDLFATVNATLWAVGDNVAIWVDDDVAIDWDYECDGLVDVVHPRPAFGFDNCDLATVADIVDDNIVPNVRSLYGNESDIDGDGKVSVVISPLLNSITLTSDDETVQDDVLASYAEPQVDLREYSYDSNPGSDEQEVVYVFAPDPYGFYNPNATPTVEDYTSYQLAAEVARSFTTLVTYNQKVVEREAAMEEDWVNDALGTFAADWCGFGAAWHLDVWEYLDAPHLHPLVVSDPSDSLESLNKGAQYLFARWLYDYAEATGAGGAALLQAIAQSEDVGTDGILAAASQVDPELTFEDLAVLWQVAVATGGMTDDDGDALVDPSVYPPISAPTTIVAPPDSPGIWYGANGYQQGIVLHGVNHAYTDGTTDAPRELDGGQVRVENTDAFHYAPGFPYVGWADGNYGAHVVRLTGIPYAQARLELQATGTDVVGYVVRLNDPDAADVVVEDIYAATDANWVELPALPEDGTPVHGIGQISAPGVTFVVDAAGDATAADVEDTDRWLLDLTDRAWGEQVDVAVWIDRQFADSNGGSGPDDPWVAVVPAELVPEPTVEGTARGSACPDGVEFAYPVTVLEYLYDQIFLSGTMIDGSEDDFDACGSSAGTATTCDADWDRDGVLDDEEPVPTSFWEQILTMECTANGNVAPAPSTYTEAWMDVDEQDDDELATYSARHNTGGRAGAEGEEGYVSLTLQGGKRYVVVVGGNGGNGVYELSVRQTR